MAGLKGSSTEIGADGVTVTVTADSEATARELAAELETRVRKTEGGPGAKINNWLSNSANRLDETLAIYGGVRLLAIIRDALLVCAMTIAVFAWLRILPGYEILLGTVGALITFAMKSAAGKIYEAEQQGDKNLRGMLLLVMAAGLVLEVMASSSLQAYTAVQAETGRADVEAEIHRLDQERQTLLIKLAKVPDGASAAIAERISAYQATPMVNREGSQLTKTVGSLWDETGCKGNSYYVGMYCPTLLELQSDYQTALDYEKAQRRFDEIGPMITKLQGMRPKGSSTFALATKVADNDTKWILALLVPVGITFVLNLAMLLLSYIVGRIHYQQAHPAPAPAPVEPAPVEPAPTPSTEGVV